MGIASQLIFFFSSRRRHTRCGRDWSSDVCSSDLAVGRPVLIQRRGALIAYVAASDGKIGRASCRERVEISVVAVSLKKKDKSRVGAGCDKAVPLEQPRSTAASSLEL